MLSATGSKVSAANWATVVSARKTLAWLIGTPARERVSQRDMWVRRRAPLTEGIPQKDRVREEELGEGGREQDGPDLGRPEAALLVKILGSAHLGRGAADTREPKGPLGQTERVARAARQPSRDPSVIASGSGRKPRKSTHYPR